MSCNASVLELGLILRHSVDVLYQPGHQTYLGKLTILCLTTHSFYCFTTEHSECLQSGDRRLPARLCCSAVLTQLLPQLLPLLWLERLQVLQLHGSSSLLTLLLGA